MMSKALTTDSHDRCNNEAPPGAPASVPAHCSRQDVAGMNAGTPGYIAFAIIKIAASPNC